MNGKRIIACALLAAAACAPAAPALADATAAPAPYSQTAAAACPSPQAQTVVDYLRVLTRAMQEISGPATQMNLVNMPLLLIGQGPVPQVITGLNSTTSLADQAVAQISTLKPLTGCDAEAVADAYRAFATVSQQTLNVLIGKAGVLGSAGQFAAPPIEAALRQFEPANDAIAFTLINLLPDNAAGAAVKADATSLASTLSTAITTYSNAGS